MCGSLAMGIAADSDEDPIDRAVRKDLTGLASNGDALARGLALIALAQASTRSGAGAGDPLAGLAEARARDGESENDPAASVRAQFEFEPMQVVEGMLASGYEGTREIQKRLNNTLGWSATSGQVDNWVYEDANDVYMKDPEMQKRLMESNPNSFRKMVANFLEANGRGYWETSEENIERLRNLYMEVEDRIEGVEN